MADIASIQTRIHYTLSNKGSKRPFTIPPFLLDMRGEADEFFLPGSESYQLKQLLHTN